MRKIEIRGVHGMGYHGVLAIEKQCAQVFYVDAVLEVAVSRCFSDESDLLTDTVDYSQCAQIIYEVITRESYQLIETLADSLCRKLLTYSHRIDNVTIRVEKPDAPVSVPFITVATERSMCREEIANEKYRSSGNTSNVLRETVVLSLGSNQGDALENLAQAIRFLPGVLRVSSPYVTVPWGNREQNDFHNIVVFADSRCFRPQQWLQYIHLVENFLGRRRHSHWGPRTLDIDIIYWFNSHSEPVIFSDENLTIPHMYAFSREFVMTPWAQLSPSCCVSDGHTTTTVQAIAERLKSEEEHPAKKLPYIWDDQKALWSDNSEGM